MTQDCIDHLRKIGVSYDDAVALRRIAMTLHRWHELECGDGNNYGSWAIERDDAGDGPPFMVHHHYTHGRGGDYTTRTKIPDREAGALKRLGNILKHYPGLSFYIQGDPRGAPLYILKPRDIPAGEDVGGYYSRGIAVYK